MKKNNKKILALIAYILTAFLGNLNADILDVEKDTLKFGFIKLTDCAPIVIAKEKGYFDDEGLSVEVEAQGNWKELLNRVINGDLDGAHMLAGQPIGATVGFGTKADVLTAYSLDYNGNGITVSNDIWKQMKPNVKKDAAGKVIHPITADSLKPIADKAKSNNAKLKMGMVFPVSTHNYEIRYWLAASGISPGFYYDPGTKQRDIAGFLNSDVELSVTPPPQMPQTLEAGTICAYCVGEPWNQQAVFKKIGVPVTTNYDIWKNNPETCEKKIMPFFNRVVIFNTNDYSLHGHPEALNCPENMSRKSIALYYYSNGRPNSDLKGYDLENNTFFIGSKNGFFWRKTLKNLLPPFITKSIKKLLNIKII